MRLNTIVLVVVIMFAIYLACSTKLIGFHYPEIVNDQPFDGGIRITSIEGLRIKLENGLLLKMENDDSFKHEKVQMAIGDLVKIETDDNENFQIHARVNGWVCGTPWASLITIPIVKDRVYKNKIKFVGFANKVDE